MVKEKMGECSVIKFVEGKNDEFITSYLERKVPFSFSFLFFSFFSFLFS